MNVWKAWGRGAVACLPALVLLVSEGAAQEDASRWRNVAELTFVLTAGNASSSTFGLKNTTEHQGAAYGLAISLGGVRTESGTTTRVATGTPEDFQVSETTDHEVTAESYFAKARLDRSLGESAFAFGGAGWDRNTFAGIQNRYGLVVGGGRSWFEEEDRRLKTDLGMTFTIQEDVQESPDGDDSFLGLRGSLDFLHGVSGTTDLASVLIVDQNLNSTDDLRADWTNSLAVAMSERLALKTSLQVLFDNRPALTAVPLGEEEVLVELGKVDTVFSVAVVANF